MVCKYSCVISGLNAEIPETAKQVNQLLIEAAELLYALPVFVFYYHYPMLTAGK